MLVQAGASSTRRLTNPIPAAGLVCAQTFRVGFVADVAGLDSRADAAGWGGVRSAVRRLPCARADAAVAKHPAEYGQLLQAYAGYDLVIAGSFLLTDPVVDIAPSNPGTHFVLVDPIVAPAGPANLAVLVFREDQAAFLAGALAGMVSKTGVIAGVYGPFGAADQRNRAGFEHGAAYVRPGIRVLGAYQPAADGLPYANPGWGAAQAREFSQHGADVIFGTGGSTGKGALRGAAQSGRFCIGGDEATDPTLSDCLLANAIKHVDRGVALIVADAAGGHWSGGLRSLGLSEGAVELAPVQHQLSAGQLQDLQTIAARLAAGALTTGA